MSVQLAPGKTSQILAPKNLEAMAQLASRNKRKKNFIIAPIKPPGERATLGDFKRGDTMCKTLIGELPVSSRNARDSMDRSYNSPPRKVTR